MVCLLLASAFCGFGFPYCSTYWHLLLIVAYQPIETCFLLKPRFLRMRISYHSNTALGNRGNRQSISPFMRVSLKKKRLRNMQRNTLLDKYNGSADGMSNVCATGGSSASTKLNRETR